MKRQREPSEPVFERRTRARTSGPPTTTPFVWPTTLQQVFDERVEQQIRQECLAEQMHRELGAPFLRTVAQLLGIEPNQTKAQLCHALSQRLQLSLVLPTTTAAAAADAQQQQVIRGVFSYDDLANLIQELKAFQDPITRDVMTQPVVLVPCGHTFDLSGLQNHFATSGQELRNFRCPLDNIPIVFNQCVPNILLRQTMEQLFQKYGIEQPVLQPLPDIATCRLNPHLPQGYVGTMGGAYAAPQQPTAATTMRPPPFGQQQPTIHYNVIDPERVTYPPEDEALLRPQALRERWTGFNLILGVLFGMNLSRPDYLDVFPGQVAEFLSVYQALYPEGEWEDLLENIEAQLGIVSPATPQAFRERRRTFTSSQRRQAIEEALNNALRRAYASGRDALIDIQEDVGQRRIRWSILMPDEFAELLRLLSTFYSAEPSTQRRLQQPMISTAAQMRDVAFQMLLTLI